ncbi:MAG: UDP-N-acetylmuramoyl-L-alanine--D-glutamate ligase [Clostridia bacterium]|nr:UDP-N-acetylmuramoyl-L-alanine--D-glutamate ligase [Clostridia bacterium]
MDASHLLNKKGCALGFLGLGKSNLSLIEGLPRGRRIVLRSDKTIDRAKIPKNVVVDKIYEGPAALDDIREDILVLSPSVRRERAELDAAARRGVVLSSDCEMFFERTKTSVIGVSGSSGKSTTSTLTHLALGGEARGIRLVGNVGVPMLHSINRDTVGYVAELSSFMLQYFTPRLHRYALTNITPNHLDFHKDFEEYKAAKLRPLRLCGAGVICADDSVLASEKYAELFAVYSARESLCDLVAKYSAEVYFTVENGYILRNGEKILEIGSLTRTDRYSILNVECALALADGLVDREYAIDAVRRFKGLAHRCETVHSYGGVDFIDSSIDTTPERCSATLELLARRVVLLLGGRGKGLSYDVMIPPVLKYARFAVLFGEEAEKIFSALSGRVECAVRPDFSDAVRLAASVANKGEAVLLSPACTSYDAFSSFEERGDKFASIVRSL